MLNRPRTPSSAAGAVVSLIEKVGETKVFQEIVCRQRFAGSGIHLPRRVSHLQLIAGAHRLGLNGSAAKLCQSSFQYNSKPNWAGRKVSINVAILCWCWQGSVAWPDAETSPRGRSGPSTGALTRVHPSAASMLESRGAFNGATRPPVPVRHCDGQSIQPRGGSLDSWCAAVEPASPDCCLSPAVRD